MKIKYIDFVNEKNETIISLIDVEKSIKNIFTDTKVSSVNSIYEKKGNKLNLIITINNLYYNKTNIIHTKFVFDVDDKKSKLTSNYLFYLYDLNCNFKRIDFDSLSDMENKLNDVMDKRRFGKDLKKLSDVTVQLGNLVNGWFKDNKISNISVLNISYSELVQHVPCEALSFNYEISLNNNRVIKMNLKKVNENDFLISYKEEDWNKEESISDLSMIAENIGEMIKEHILEK